MKQTLFSGSRTGVVTAPASKSMAHRLFIAAALGCAPMRIRCSGLSAAVSAGGKAVCRSALLRLFPRRCAAAA